MPNPYNITEVDVPGIIGAYQNQQDRRLQQMAAQRQMQLQDRQIEQQDKAAQAWAKFYQRQAPQGGAAGAASAYGTPGSPATPPQAAAPPQAAYDPMNDPAAQQELLASLSGVTPPEQVMQLRTAFQNHSKEARAQAAAGWKTIGNAALSLRQLPPDQRAAELQRMAPMLRELGADDDMLSQVDLSDHGLETIVAQSRDIEQVIHSLTPTVVPVTGVGLVPMTPGSPYPDFANGGARPEAQVGQAQGIGEGTVIQNDAGEQMILRNGQWVPAGGGAGNGTGGFPGN